MAAATFSPGDKRQIFGSKVAVYINAPTTPILNVYHIDSDHPHISFILGNIINKLQLIIKVN